MTDPVSVTASAAGIVSLAISVCKSFVGYYGSWKSYGEDIKKLCQYLELVSNSMRHLQICIESHQFPVGLKQQVESSILGCTEEIRTLSAELVLVKATELPEGPQEKVKCFFRRAQYPFKESTLKKIGDSVLRLQAVVDFAQSNLGV
jgi:ankyrin repeat domain-containing protein 50